MLRIDGKLAIYGAQVVAHGAYTAIKSLYGVTPECFVVSKVDGNPITIDDIPVKSIKDCGLSKDVLIIVAVTELLQDEICRSLTQMGFTNQFVLSSHEEHLLMSAYYGKIGKFNILENVRFQPVAMSIYEMRSRNDKPIANSPNTKPWIHPFVAGLTDAEGVNIAGKNKQYFELEAMYWLWKNVEADWKGVFHYRRHLVIEPDIIGNADVVMPMPYIAYPTAETQSRRFIPDSVWDCVLTMLEAKYQVVLSEPYVYTYNLVCAKNGVFNAYCEWLFGLLFELEKYADAVPQIMETKILAYVGEALTSVYFLANSNKLDIRHAEKRIYV